MNIGPEMLFLLVLAFLLFGPKKLPEIGRMLGRGLAEFKRASNELRGQLENEMRQLEAEERQKKIWPPPANTVTALPETGSAADGTVVPAASAAVASSDSRPKSASGVEGA